MLKHMRTPIACILVLLAISACTSNLPQQPTSVTKKAPPAVTVEKTIKKVVPKTPIIYEKRVPKKRVAQRSTIKYTPRYNPHSFTNKLSNAALQRLRSRVRYDGSYVKIAYPWGDVPGNIGVCTDVVIRSYRKLGIDLQEQVHRDMSSAFHTYPNPRKWNLSRPDANIDHRRVYNLRNFLQRRGAALPITRNPRHYRPGDLVTWMVGPDLPHIGIVVNKRSRVDPNRFMIVHNIAKGPQLEDILFAFPITGHYRYTPAHMRNIPPARRFVSNSRSRNNSMTHEQLLQAAKILGTTIE